MPDDSLLDERGLIGRTHELDLVRSLVEADGAGRALLLTGEPGVGKTALLDVAEAVAVSQGLHVLRASGAEFEKDIPFSALHQLLLPLSDELDRLGGSTREAIEATLGLGATPPVDQLAVWNATFSLLRQVAAPAGLLLILDDLPWFDRPSAAVLGFVARRLGRGRIRFLGASRSGEFSLLDTIGLRRHEVSPLVDEAAAELIDTRFPSTAPQVRDRVLSEAAGNPLALLELPQALSQRPGGPSTHSTDSLPITHRLQTVFGSRVDRLSDGARQLLLLAALDSTRDLRVLRAVGEPGDTVEALDEAERAGLARVDEATQRLVFAHPLTCAAVVSLSTAAERQRAHLQLAQMYEDQPDRHGWHLAASTVKPDEAVAGVLDDAADRSLRRGDGLGAVSALLRAAELSPLARDRSIRLARAAYVGADVTGDLRGALGLLADASLADPDVDKSLQVATTAAFVLITGDGDVDTAHRLLTSALNEHESGAISRAAHIEALHTLLRVCYSAGGRIELWQDFHAHFERLTHPPFDLYVSSRTLSDPVRLAQPALAQYDRELAALSRELDPVRITRLAFAGIFVDRVSDCRQALWRVVGDGREGGAAGSAIAALTMLSLDAFRTGDWTVAQQLLLESFEIARSHGGYWNIGGRHLSAYLAAGRGDDDIVHQVTEELEQWAIPHRINSYVCTARSLAAIGRGDYEEAYQQATNSGPAGVLPSHVPYSLWTILELVESAVRTGRHAQAAAHVQTLLDNNVPALSTRMALMTHGAAAIAASDERDLRLFRHALALPGVARWPFEQARIQMVFGERLRRKHAVVEARQQLSAALETFNRLGARPWAGRAADELRATGLTGARAAHRLPDALTPQERKVALLAAEGYTNRQIGERLYLSPRTVGFHLNRVYPKLGINSRAALRDALSNLPAPKGYPDAEPGVATLEHT